jgi:hypothetical protein
MHPFCNHLLKEVMKDVRKHTTVEQRKAAWVYRYPRHTYEFQGPDKFYWYGSADCRHDAFANGWMAWLREKGYEDDEHID